MIYTGAYGFLKIGGESLLHMGNWGIEMSNEITDVVSFGEKYREKIAAIGEWSASASGTCDLGSPAKQRLLYNAMRDKTLVQFIFGLDSTVDPTLDDEEPKTFS